MNRTHSVLRILASALAAASMYAHAEPLFLPYTSSLPNVSIDETSYDVTFSQLVTGYGSTRFNDVFGASGSPELVFTNSTDALAAADAVVAAAIAFGVDVNPGSAIEGGFEIVYAYDATNFSFVRGYTSFGGYTTGPVVDFDRTTPQIMSFATFAVSNVSEPTSLPLVGAALVALGIAWRRRTRPRTKWPRASFMFSVY